MTLITKPEKKEPKPHVGARISPEHYAELIKLRDATGKSESQLISEAIAAYLGVDAAATVPARLDQLETTVGELGQQVSDVLGRFRAI